LYILSTILYNPKGGIEREMKTLRKIRKDAKALSPVVASIILIAVTVAVSIAVAAWMGALSIGFMETEQLSITKATFSDGLVTLTVRNTGTADVTINDATINGDPAPIANPTEGGAYTVGSNTSPDIELTFAWVAGDNYQVRLMSTKGNYFVYNAVAS
jgi:flagellin-like protein